MTFQLIGNQTMTTSAAGFARYGYVIPAGESMAMMMPSDRRCTDTIYPLPVDAHCCDACLRCRRLAPMQMR